MSIRRRRRQRSRPPGPPAPLLPLPPFLSMKYPQAKSAYGLVHLDRVSNLWVQETLDPEAPSLEFTVFDAVGQMMGGSLCRAGSINGQNPNPSRLERIIFWDCGKMSMMSRRCASMK
jgi:hypothetical protein